MVSVTQKRIRYYEKKNQSGCVRLDGEAEAEQDEKILDLRGSQKILDPSTAWLGMERGPLGVMRTLVGVSQRHCCTGCWGLGAKELDSPGAEAAGFRSLSARACSQGGALLVSRAEVLICPGTMSIWPLLQGGCVRHMRTCTGHPRFHLDSGRPDEATSRRD